MGRKQRTVFYCVLVVLAFFAGIGVYFHAHSKQNREASAAGTTYFIDENGKIAVPPGGTSTEARMTRGTEDNPFFALEIVPYEGYAELGYLIEGCEPVDYSRWGDGQEGSFTNYHRKLVTFFKNDPPYLMPEWELERIAAATWNRNAGKANQYGTITRVEDGTGEYKQNLIKWEYVFGGKGGYEKVEQWNTNQLNSDGTLADYNNSGIFVTFRYDTEAAGVMRYSPQINTKHNGSARYKYYALENGHWVYKANSTDATTPEFYLGNGTDYVFFVPDEQGEYVVDQVLGTKGSGIFGQVLTDSPWLDWHHYSGGLCQTAFYGVGENYIALDGGSYTKVILDATYEKVETGTSGADYKWSPLSYEACQGLTEEQKAEYRNPNYEAESFQFEMKDVEYWSGYVHDNIFVRETLDLGYEMIDGVRTPLRCASCKAAGKKDTCAQCEAVVEKRIKEYHAIVYTVTPEDLNQNFELIDRADLISVSSKNKVGSSLTLYQNFKREELSSRADTNAARAVKNYYNNDNDVATFVTNPLDWDTVLRIYERVALAECCCPIVFDTKSYKDAQASTEMASVSIPQTYANGETTQYMGKQGCSNNLFKLYLLLNQMKPALFDSLFGSLTGENFTVVDTAMTDKDGQKIKTGSFIKWDLPESATQEQKNARVYWNDYTFLPYWLMPAEGAYKEVLDSFEIMNSMWDTVYQFDSQGAQDMLTGSLFVFSTDNLMTLQFGDANAIALKNDQYGHEAYDYFDSVNGDEEGPPATLGTALSLHYIWKKTQEEAKELAHKDYRILELQSSSGSSVFKDNEEWKLFFANYAETTGEVTVDRMSVSAFNGIRTDLLSTYDLIYIGVNENPADVTMDFSPDTDYVYAHTGPELTLDQTVLQGALGAFGGENRFVYSGNDLTTLAMERLREYAEHGAPILFGDGFYTDTSATTEMYRIDRTSNVYALSVELRTDASLSASHLYEPAFVGATHVAQASKLKNALKRENTKLSVSVQPVEYDSTKALDSQKYILSGMLEYRFIVQATEGREYEVCLYIDDNRDGVFAADEQVTAELYPVTGGSEGTRILSGIVLGGGEYAVRSSLSDRTGGFSWKLALVRDGAVHAALTGVSAVKAADKKTVSVLQIVPDAPLTATVYLPQAGEVNGGTVTIPGLTVAQQQTTKKLWDAVQALTEYEFRFVRKTRGEVSEALEADAAYLKTEFDTVVLGLSEGDTGLSDALLQTAIEDFLNGGKSVVYTNDVLGLPGSGTAEVSSRFRSRFGADRYGITKLATKGEAAGLLEAFASGESSDLPLKVASYVGAVQYAETYVGATRYLLAQGLGNGVLFRYDAGLSSEVSSDRAMLLNRGMLTDYPYTLSDELTVSDAPVPGYQLDLEKETNYVFACTVADGTGGTVGTYYDGTHLDARNNYLVYSYGNVLSVGIGHSESMTGDEVRLFVNTLVGAYRQLPYGAGIVIDNTDARKKGKDYYLSVDVDSSVHTQLIGKDSSPFYYIWDGGHSVQRTGQSKKLYFRIKDENAIPAGQTARYQVSFAWDSFGTWNSRSFVVFDGTGAEVTECAANTQYYTYGHLWQEHSGGEDAIGVTKLLVTVTTQYLDGGEVTFTGETKTVLYILPRGLFDLD